MNTPIESKPASSRRAMLTTLAAAGAVALLSPQPLFARHHRRGRRHGVRRAASLTFDDFPGTGDIKVLNYALSLEDLEADLYDQALARLAALGVPASQPDVKFFKEFGRIEREHAAFIRSALTAAGGPVIPVYKHDFGIRNMSRKQVDDLVLAAEELGVMAYLGAIPFFSSDDSPYLQPAAAILGTEGRHAAVLAGLYNVLFRESNVVAPLANMNQGRDTPLGPDRVLERVAPFIITSSAFG